MTEFKALFRFGGWVTLNGMLNPILSLADRLMIGSLLGSQAVATYTVPYSVAERISVLPYAFTQALFPKMSGQNQDERADLEQRSLKALLAMMTIPTLIGVLLAEPLLSIWLGKTFDQRSAGVARVLLMNFWLACFSLLTFVRIQASGRPAVITKMLAIQMPLYVLGVYLGITYLGLIGCAWALLGRQLFNYLMASWVANRRFVGWRTLALCLASMIAAHFACEFWRLTDWRLWLLASALIILTGAATLRQMALHTHAARILRPLRRMTT
jgi:O-antigen/teichoic acid export membrane protein